MSFLPSGRRCGAGDDETRTLMRVLHEDVINRISLIREGRGPSKSKRQKR